MADSKHLYVYDKQGQKVFEGTGAEVAAYLHVNVSTVSQAVDQRVLKTAGRHFISADAEADITRFDQGFVENNRYMQETPIYQYDLEGKLEQKYLFGELIDEKGADRLSLVRAIKAVERHAPQDRPFMSFQGSYWMRKKEKIPKEVLGKKYYVWDKDANLVLQTYQKRRVVEFIQQEFSESTLNKKIMKGYLVTDVRNKKNVEKFFRDNQDSLRRSLIRTKGKKAIGFFSDTGELRQEFKSLSEAAEVLGVSRQRLSAVLKKETMQKVAGGYVVALEDKTRLAQTKQH